MSDIVIKIRYPINEPEKTEIKTNAKPEALEEILSNWIRCEIRKSSDTSEAVRLQVYEIQIELDLSEDKFTTKSNSGNTSLTLGIVSNVFKQLSSISIN